MVDRQQIVSDIVSFGLFW